MKIEEIKINKNYDYFKIIKKLDRRTRNQVRALIVSKDVDAVRMMNHHRSKKCAKELFQIQMALNCANQGTLKLTPDFFPKKPEVNESFIRLDTLDLKSNLDYIELACKEFYQKIKGLISLFGELNLHILYKNFRDADNLVSEIYKKHGASHFLLRKAALISVVKAETDDTPAVDSFLEDAEVKNNNLISSSLINCFHDSQDYLSMKRSLMSIPDKAKFNQFTRDMVRIAFQPYAFDEKDLEEFINSCLQSSLIDAVLILKVNSNYFDENKYEFCKKIFNDLDQIVSIDDFAKFCLTEEDGETVFYKRSSAWLESKQVVRYRLLQDNFFDTPDATYISKDEYVINEIESWVGDYKLIDLPYIDQLTKHNFNSLRCLENDGYISRSSIFNFILYRNSGRDVISEDGLIRLMGHTRDLAKTIDPKALKNLAVFSKSEISKIICYLLVAKKSRNEVDNHHLRRILQDLVLRKFDKKLVDFVKWISLESRAIAEFAYEVFTEDFIAKLPNIVKSASEITETRADLHRWMGEFTGDKVFLDRARTLLIDYQINKIRNELDDNRIYVDSARISDWLNDELIRDINAIFTGMEHNNTLDHPEDPQLIHIIKRCYAAFCSNQYFGIASYLGRRIRHGTFKGHLFKTVVASMESNDRYARFLADSGFKLEWQAWKNKYESLIDAVIRDKLHVESNSKREGFLKLGIDDPGKYDIALACARSLVKDFQENRSSISSPQILIEYCWRLLEVDLSGFNAYLKKNKVAFLEMPTYSRGAFLYNECYKEFCRDLTYLISNKLLAMHGWFKRPISVSPKASLSLLYKAVVSEVAGFFNDFVVNTDFEEVDDIELVGGAYHVLYDAFYVVIFNAAKHGKKGGEINKFLGFLRSEGQRKVLIRISSEIRDEESEELVNSRLRVNPEDDIAGAQMREDRSGIKKLYNLQKTDPYFGIEEIVCRDRKVTVAMTYSLEH